MRTRLGIPILLSFLLLFASCNDASKSARTPSSLLDTTPRASATAEKTVKATNTPKPADTPKATSSPKPSATAKPDNTPAPPPQQPATSGPAATAPAGLTVAIVSVTSPISAGGTAMLVANVPPGAACRLAYTTPAGNPSTANGLGAATADGSGSISWSWNISGATNPGTGKLSVTCAGTPAVGGTIVIQ